MATSDLAVLMALRVHGRGDAARVARAVGCDPAAADALLAALAARGATVPVAPAPGTPPRAVPAPLVTLSDDGRALLARIVAEEPIDRGALVALYDTRFPAADRGLKEAITAWQLAADAAKPAAQSAVMAAAAAVGGVAAALAAVAPRLAPYPRRIADAAAAIATGDLRFVASPRVDSLHQIWFELHEDLLVTLGRSRGA
ncbi:MAG: hypothetical protein IT294_05210 [Deltaproteobacteria bacterium]|nr:hypothetical protein [Deltaproteobacteria bacterium]